VKADAPRPLRIPAWVPSSVAEKARELHRRSPPAVSPALLRALVTDKRMRAVWHELAKRRRGGGYLHPARQPKEPVADPQGLGMTVLFLQALKIMHDLDRPPPVSRKEMAAARREISAAARTLRTLAPLLLEPPSDQLDREDARKLAAAAPVLDELAAKRGARDRGNTEIRYITSSLVKTCRIIFGASHYRIVARIASVMLATVVSESTVRTWDLRE
jgi:hypothetical protein